jgi:ribosome-associated translation inhibitor RaiA
MKGEAFMRIDVRIPGAGLLESLKAHAVSRVQPAIASLSSQLPRASVRLSEFCGHGTGAVLTACRIEASADTLPEPVIAEARAPNPYRAIDEAAARLAELLQGERRADWAAVHAAESR